MSSLLAGYPVSGMMTSFSPVPKPTHQATPRRDLALPPDAFAEVVGLYQSNEYLLSELTASKAAFRRALTYLRTPGGNPVLAQAQIDRIRARRSAILTLLRANRLQARSLLEHLDSPAS